MSNVALADINTLPYPAVSPSDSLILNQLLAELQELRSEVAGLKAENAELKTALARKDKDNETILKDLYRLIRSHFNGPRQFLQAIEEYLRSDDKPDLSDPGLDRYLSHCREVLMNKTSEDYHPLVEAHVRQSTKRLFLLLLKEASRGLQYAPGTTAPAVNMTSMAPVMIRANILKDHVYKTKQPLTYRAALNALTLAYQLAGDNWPDLKPAQVYRAMRRAAWLDRGLVYEKAPGGIRLRILEPDEPAQEGIRVDFRTHIGTC